MRDAKASSSSKGQPGTMSVLHEKDLEVDAGDVTETKVAVLCTPNHFWKIRRGELIIWVAVQTEPSMPGAHCAGEALHALWQRHQELRGHAAEQDEYSHCCGDAGVELQAGPVSRGERLRTSHADVSCIASTPLPCVRTLFNSLTYTRCCLCAGRCKEPGGSGDLARHAAACQRPSHDLHASHVAWRSRGAAL